MELEKRFCRSFSLKPAAPTVYIRPDGKVQVKSCPELKPGGICGQAKQSEERCRYLEPQTVIFNMSRQ